MSHRFLSPSKVRAYLDCPRRFKFRYQDRLEPAEPAIALVVGSLLHAALARYHETEATTTDEVFACVEAAISASGDFDAELVAQARGDVLGCLLDYHAAAPEVRGERRTELALRGRAGPLTLATVADLVWWDHGGVLVHDEFKLSPPAYDALLLQTVMTRVGLRQQLHPDGPIRHRLLSFRPQFAVKSVDLDERVYREVLRTVLDTAHTIARDRTFEPTPGPACSNCDYALVCTFASRALDAVPF